MNFQRYARLSCFSFFVNAALCTNNNIVHLVDLLSADNLRNIFGRGIRYLNTRSSVKLNNISLFSRRCNLVRSTLSFPTARSIFTLPAVYIYKIVPSVTGKFLAIYKAISCRQTTSDLQAPHLLCKDCDDRFRVSRKQNCSPQSCPHRSPMRVTAHR